jgi:8-oxo-dGTP pyrophosphatase MutT (NUDIX family)
MAAMVDSIRQASVIPIRNGRVCLVRSSSGKRWVVPKGHIESGQTAGETALQEAWEEAGLVGSLRPEPCGSYLYEKERMLHHVIVFLMNVTKVAARWPESDWRQRRWVDPSRALAHLQHLGLRKLMRGMLDAELAELSFLRDD